MIYIIKTISDNTRLNTKYSSTNEKYEFYMKYVISKEVNDMINVLIADDNISYAINLMNYINVKNENIKICNIAKNGKETLEILNINNNIDVILLDYKMPIYNGEQVLNKIIDKNKYNDSFIIISGEIESAIKLRDNKMVHSILFKTIGMNEMVQKINEVFKYKEIIPKSKFYREKIINEILYLRYDMSHKGTQYLIKAIEYIIDNPNKELENLEKDIYPHVAKVYSETNHNIKCRINRATNSMYCNCEIDKLKKISDFV